MTLIIADPDIYAAMPSMQVSWHVSYAHKKAERNLITLCFYRPLLSSIAIYYEYHLPL